ncbi:GTP 3',8-cyclase MoaA [Leptolyngbya sp. FACHB-261]|uniref:GTP 3',8-cyclase MoaA n=1 Tax=Leptolyngbya sp. FACHB-261 TaxID=2692806 RepID=UPI0016868E38|nr:GTP 3',8-cyclase MoaA [Leptolyngbya sp. FACHB-261]MBD2103516.1 GTP 3',8-cyclase MoaA [Leptolyngbya sp. FACHB-261]
MNPVDYLRVSLIDRCNFRCTYCMPEGQDLEFVQRQDLLTDAELLTLLRDVFIPLGFTKFRLTGGEPLIRPGVVDLIQQIAHLPGLSDLSMTTNAYLLADLAPGLYEAGLRRINISLDSLDPEVFRQITGRNHWQRVWQGILAAHAAGFNPLKLNVVVIPGVNDTEVLDLAALTLERDWHVRFIEFMPIGNAELFEHKGWVDSETLRQRIRERWGLIESAVRGNGPADIFQIPGAQGTLGFISQMSECFCDRCNRMRLSADGWLRPCLLNETGQLDLRQALRKEQDLTEVRSAVAELLRLKPEINFKARDRGTDTNYSRTMVQIGG